MTPRWAGWLTGVVTFSSMAALEGAVMIAGIATDAGEARGGEPALALAIRVAPLAPRAGVLVACIAASRRGRRAAMVAVDLVLLRDLRTGCGGSPRAWHAPPRRIRSVTCSN